MAYFTGSDLNTAIQRYYEITGSPYQDFYNWLDTTWETCIKEPLIAPVSLEDWKYQIPDHTKHRIELLLSPHYKTLYKAWQIKSGKKDAWGRNVG
jgi:hypothetical protein